MPPIVRVHKPAPAVISAETPTSAGTRDDGESVLPPNPNDHGGTVPLLSRLLAPPFNAQLRREFLVSLTKHLADYGDDAPNIVDESLRLQASLAETPVACETVDAGSDIAAGGKGDSKRGVAPVRQTFAIGEEAPERKGVSAATGGGVGGDLPGLANNRADRATPTATSAFSEVMASAGSARDIETSSGDAGKSGVVCEKGSSGGVMRSAEVDGGGRRGGACTSTASSRGREARASSWAQEYHDYLCSKEG